MRVKVLILSGCCLLGCAGAAPPPAVSGPPPKVEAPVRPVVEAPAKPPPGALWREDVLSTVDAGLGRFLQHVAVEPKLEDGAFRGFQIVALQPESFWQGSELQTGDVVTAVNGMPIERETQAFDAFQALKSAKVLIVSYRREGEARELKYKIIEKPGVASAAPAASAVKTAPAAPTASATPAAPAAKH